MSSERVPEANSLEQAEAEQYAAGVLSSWAALETEDAEPLTEMPQVIEDYLRAVEEAAARQLAEGVDVAAVRQGDGHEDRPEDLPPLFSDAAERAATVRVCLEQIALAAYIRRVFRTERLIIEGERLQKYLSLEKYFPFELFPWEKFLLALWLCVYKAPGLPRWPTVFCLIGRGAGKDGFIGYVSFCAVSPYNPVAGYDVDICANDEEQAMRPVKDVLDVLESPRRMAKLKKHFYHTKELAQGRKNRGIIRGRTNNPKHRDGMRSGLIVFNEIHAYENYNNIKVFRTGLGKRDEPREGSFTSNGTVEDGPLDDMLEHARRILFGDEPDNGLLPFVCCLPAESLVHDPANWSMANPSLPCLPTLRGRIAQEYAGWRERPEEHADFLTKRMGLRKGYKEISVTEYAKVKATASPLPDLRGWKCTVGIDFAELSDFASVNAHFRKGEQRFDVCKTWICLQSKTLHRVRAPYREWARLPLFGNGPSPPLRATSPRRGEESAAVGTTTSAAAAAPSPRGKGRGEDARATARVAPTERPGSGPDEWMERQTIVELVDDVSIGPQRIADFIRQLGAICVIRMIAMDNFRWSAMAEELRKIGFDAKDRSRVKLVRPSDIMQVDPVVQECFDRGLFVWGNNPCLRWAVNNTKRIRRGKADGTDTGNFYYGKIEAKSRKTDPFMALVAAMTAEKELGTGEAAQLPPVGAISF